MTSKAKKVMVARTAVLLDEIVTRMVTLSELWMTAFDDDDLTDALDDALCAKYPFEDSFDMMAMRAVAWEEAVYEKLDEYVEKISVC